MVADVARGRVYERLGREIARAREAAGLSQPALARAASVSQGYIGLMETGERRGSPEVLRALARALDVDAERFLILGNYMDEREGDVTIPVSPEQAGPMRRLSEYGPEWLRYAIESIERAQEVVGRSLSAEAAPDGDAEPKRRRRAQKGDAAPPPPDPPA